MIRDTISVTSFLLWRSTHIVVRLHGTGATACQKQKVLSLERKTRGNKTKNLVKKNPRGKSLEIFTVLAFLKAGFFFRKEEYSILLHRAVLLYCCTGPLQSPGRRAAYLLKNPFLCSHTSKNMAGSSPTSRFNRRHQQNRKLCHSKPRPDSRFNGIPEASAKPESMS